MVHRNYQITQNNKEYASELSVWLMQKSAGTKKNKNKDNNNNKNTDFFMQIMK